MFCFILIRRGQVELIMKVYRKYDTSDDVYVEHTEYDDEAPCDGLPAYKEYDDLD